MFRADTEARKDILDTFAAALQAWYAGRLPEAAGLFEKIALVDTPACIYAERCRLLASAPQRPWTGIWVMTREVASDEVVVRSLQN